MFFAISCLVRSPPYQTPALNGLGVVASYVRICWTVIAAEGTAPEANAFVDGWLFEQVAVPAVLLSTIGQTAVRSTRNPPKDPGARKLDGGLILPLAGRAIRAGSLKYTSRAVANICAFSIVFM